MKHNDFQGLLQQFFMKRLIRQQNASACTVSSYRDTFRILLQYFWDVLRIPPDKIYLHDVSANIAKFLDHLETERKNVPATVNNRLASIKSFFDFVSYECPEYIDDVRKVRLIPARRTASKEVNYLVRAEIDALIRTCSNTAAGKRDQLMILMLFNTGMRVSELTGLHVGDIRFDDKFCIVSISGKGRKERSVPIWKETQKLLMAYISQNNIEDTGFLFPGKGSSRLSRSGVRYRIDCLVNRARESCPSLKKKTITPHVFRHSTAMALLKSGIDISTIAIWLGHESIETTHKYMISDINLKEMALEKVDAPKSAGKQHRYRPAKDIINFLESL